MMAIKPLSDKSEVLDSSALGWKIFKLFRGLIFLLENRALIHTFYS